MARRELSSADLPPLASEARAAAKLLLSYLAESDALPDEPADAAIGFGIFDFAPAHACAELFLQGRVKKILFTGGIGGGTGDLGGPEADIWGEHVLRAYPALRPEDIIRENRSANTGENVAFTAALLARHYPALAFGTGIASAVLVASPSRLRRVGLTMRQQAPAVRVFRHAPPVDFDRERGLYERQLTPYLPHLLGELDRLDRYAAEGWIAPEPIPPHVRAAQQTLRALL